VKLVGGFLGERGYQCVAAPDGLAALEAFAPGRFDLVLMDVNMPRMNGVVATGKIHRRDPCVPILLVSGEAGSREVFAALSAGADSLISKPVDLERLAARAAEYVALARRRRRLARRERRRAERSAPRKAVHWMTSKSNTHRRRRALVRVMVVFLAVAAGLGSVAAADWALNASRLTTGVFAQLSTQLSRIEGYLQRDEQREMEKERKDGAPVPPPPAQP